VNETMFLQEKMLNEGQLRCHELTAKASSRN